MGLEIIDGFSTGLRYSSLKTLGERYVQNFVSRNTRVILISEALIKTKPIMTLFSHLPMDHNEVLRCQARCFSRQCT